MSARWLGLGERRGWSVQDLVLLALMIGCAIWATRDAWADILGRALNDSENGQILFVPFVAAYLFWLRRSRLQFLRYRPSLLGPVVIAAGLVLSHWGIERDVLIAWHFGAIVAIVGCALSLTGVALVTQFSAVLLALLFLLPIPGSVRTALAGPLQSFGASMTVGILEIAQIDAVREGSVILVGAERVPVAIGEACNGMRMVFALILVVYAFVFSLPFRFESRAILLALSPLIALLCNVVRLVPTSLVYGYFDPATAERFHDWAGIAMVPVALLFLVGIVRFMRWLDLPVMSWRLSAA